MNKLYSDEGSLNCYYAYPKGLMGLGLGDTDKCVYLLLLDRARMSARNGDKWRDAQGRVFLCYPVAALARDLGCSESTVYEAMNALEGRDLIYRQRQGRGRPSRIYVKLPPAAGISEAPDLRVSEAPDLRVSEAPDLRTSGGPDLRTSGEVTSELPEPNKKERNKQRDLKGHQHSSFSSGEKTKPAGPTREEYARMLRLAERLERLA